MGTKEQLLSLFENNKGVYLSGEEIANKLNISRTAVWKAVNALKKAGYEIASVNNKGYALAESTDKLSVQGIERYLLDSCKDLDITVLDETESTNADVKNQASKGAKDGTVIIAKKQTAGRGRRGRNFYSPSETGVYLSVLLRPENLSPEKALKFTTMAAVAGANAITKVSGEKAGIKWVNDIFLREKKVVGILTEGSLSMETGLLDYAVMGIGFNAYEPENGFPEELKGIAGAIFTEPQSDGKNRLAAEFLNEFWKYYKSDASYIAEYRKLSLALGRDITVLDVNGDQKAKAIDVDDDCHLLVEFPDGTRKSLSSGEISIRL